MGCRVDVVGFFCLFCLFVVSFSFLWGFAWLDGLVWFVFLLFEGESEEEEMLKALFQ